MKLYRAVLVLYLAAVAAQIAAGQGNDNGNNNGVYNTGNQNGNTNGNLNLGSLNGNSNGGFNLGDLNGNQNGNLNTGSLNGNVNGNGNRGSGNGGGNGNLNLGSLNGNGNGNGNTGSRNGNGNGVGNIGSGNGNGNGNGNAGGQGDPIFTGFAGRAFEFEGTPGTYYNILSERNHQLATKLKVGVMWDHNGTYMEGLGFHYRSHKVVVELNPANPDTMAVTLDGEPLAIKEGQVELDHVVESADVQAELTLHWHLHRADFGESIELQTELMKLLIWVTPAGTVDEGGVEQPSYLNFDTTLLAAPLGNEMQGIVGETYARLLAGADEVQDPEHPLYKPDDFKFHGNFETEEYEMEGYFDESHTLSLLGKSVTAASRRLLNNDLSAKVAFPLHAGGGVRRLSQAAETETAVKFPLTASGRGLVRQQRPAFRKAEASGGRRGLF